LQVGLVPEARCNKRVGDNETPQARWPLANLKLTGSNASPGMAKGILYLSWIPEMRDKVLEFLDEQIHCPKPRSFLLKVRRLAVTKLIINYDRYVVLGSRF